MKFWPQLPKSRSHRINGERSCHCTNMSAGNAARHLKNSSGPPPTHPSFSALRAEAANSRNGFRALLRPENPQEPAEEAAHPQAAVEAGDEPAVSRIASRNVVFRGRRADR